MGAPDHLRALVEGQPDHQLVSVPAGWVRALLADRRPDSLPPVEVDLTCEEVGELLHRDPSVVRGWVRARQFPGAYKLSGREWRIPREAVTAFQRQQRAEFERAA